MNLDPLLKCSVIVAFALLASSCGPKIQPNVKAKLGRAPDCRTAEHDISVLQKERASTAGRLSSGVQSVLPIAAAGNLLMGQYDDGIKVATGEYNKDLERKINEIKEVCNIS